MGAIFGIIGRYSSSEFELMKNILSFRSRMKHIRQYTTAEGFIADLRQKAPVFFQQTPFHFVLDGYIKTERNAQNTQFQLKPLLKNCSGLYAGAIFEPRLKKLSLFRDPSGARPLYWSLSPDGRLVFASSPRAIHLVTTKPQLNPVGLYHYLSMITPPDPDTIFLNIHALRPGFVLVFQNGEISVQSFWKPSWSSRDTYEGDTSRLAKELRTILESSIINAIPSQIEKTGFFLSGGTDTSTVVGLAAKAGIKPIQTFTIGYKGQSREFDLYNEFEYARIVARHFGTKHHEFSITPESLLKFLPGILYYMDQPSGDAINSYLVASTIPDSIDWVMSGTGGDELFIGSHWFKQQAALIRKHLIWMHLPSFIRTTLSKCVSLNTSNKWSRRIISAIELEEGIQAQYRHIKFIFHESEKHHLLTSEFLATLPQGIASHKVVEMYDTDQKYSDPVNRFMALLFKHEVSNLQLRDLDAMCAAHQLEARSPLVDRPVLEYLIAIPGQIKAPDGQLRYLMFKALQDVLLEQTIKRRKMSFIVPMDIWAHQDLKPVIQRVLSRESIEKRNIFRPDFIQQIMDDYYKRNRERHPFKIWNLALFELWCRIHIDHPGNGFPDKIQDIL